MTLFPIIDYSGVMGDQFKLNQHGNCSSCGIVTITVENIQCIICKGIFHGACPNMSSDDKPGTKTLVDHFSRPSTKKNFKFFCDGCLTNFEINSADSETNRLNAVEGNISSIKAELEEIKSLLKTKAESTTAKGKSNSFTPTDNIWFDKTRLESTKIPPTEPMLVMKDSVEVNESVERAIVENSISVTKSYKNNSGERVVVCDNQDSRNRLQTIIASTTENVEIKQTTKKKPSVTIVGLSKQYTKEEITNLLVTQNQHLKQFSTSNDINEHLEIHDIKPTRAKANVFQVFASVSEGLRKGLRNFSDKITIGLISCKVYDRFHVKRCNNCQGLGHFYKDCPTPTESSCAKCSQNHPTNTCTNTEVKCVNCCKAGVESNHTAYDPKCPSMISEVDKKKQLNLRRTTMALQAN